MDKPLQRLAGISCLPRISRSSLWRSTARSENPSSGIVDLEQVLIDFISENDGSASALVIGRVQAMTRRREMFGKASSSQTPSANIIIIIIGRLQSRRLRASSSHNDPVPIQTACPSANIRLFGSSLSVDCQLPECFPSTYLISKGFEKWNIFLPEQHAFFFIIQLQCFIYYNRWHDTKQMVGVAIFVRKAILHLDD